MPPLLPAVGAPGELQVFLSSTIEDYRALREKVRDALVTKAECACHPSEGWVNSYADTLNLCRHRVLGSGGYILLLGFWYGSIPPEGDKSITHLEFEWALQKWGAEHVPPMAVFKPRAGSPAAQDLTASAQPLLPAQPADRDRHARNLQAFHEAVAGKSTAWRTISFFENVNDLRENAIVHGLKWRGQTLLPTHAEDPAVAAANSGSELTDEQLGALGRKVQDDTLNSLLARLPGSGPSPAMAVVVHGDEGAGQRAFLARAIRQRLKKFQPKRPIGRLPLGSQTVPALVAWLAQTLAIPHPAGVETPEQLADRVALELQQTPLYFVLDRLNDLQGGLVTFQRDFWQPFWERLRVLRAQLQLPHRLVAIVADYATPPAAWAAARTPAAPGAPPDYRFLLELPRLGPITDADLYEWFQEFEVPDDAHNRLATLVERALHDGAGALDPMPLRVFERLRSETLWPDPSP